MHTGLVIVDPSGQGRALGITLHTNVCLLITVLLVACNESNKYIRVGNFKSLSHFNWHLSIQCKMKR